MADLTVKVPEEHADYLAGMLGMPVGQAPDQSLPPDMTPPQMPAGGALPPIPDHPEAQPAGFGDPGSVTYQQAKLNQDVSRPKPGALGQIGGWAASILTPNIAAMIPQTPLGRIAQLGQDRAQLAQSQQEQRAQKQEASEEDLRTAQAGEATAKGEAATAGASKVEVHDPITGQTYSIPQKDLAGFAKTITSQTGAGQRTDSSNQSKEDIAKDKRESDERIASGRNLNAKDIERMRTESAERIATGKNLTSTEVARIRASAQTDPDKLTNTMKTMKQQAQATLPQIDKTLDETEKVASKLGPTEGRWNDFWQGKVGASDPEFAHYKDQVGLVSSAVTLAHARGRMSNELFDHFQKMFDAGKQSPENMIQALNVAKDWLTDYANMGEKGSPVGNAPGGPGTPPPGAKIIKLEDFLKGK